MDSGRRALADREEPRQARAAGIVDDDASDRVVGRRRHRDQITPRVEPGARERLRDVGKPSGVDASHVEDDVSFAAAGELLVYRPRDLVPWCQLRDEPLLLAVQQETALAPDGLGDQEAVELSLPRERGGMELKQLEVGQLRPRHAGEVQSPPHPPRRVRGPSPKSRRSAGRKDGCSGRHRAGVRHHPHAMPLLHPQGKARGLLVDGDQVVRDDRAGERVRHLPPRCAAPRVDDPAP